MGCLRCEKYSKQCKTMPPGPPEFIPPFIPVTGMKCSYGKISWARLWRSREPSQPARPLIRTHQKCYKGFRGKARSRKPGQPGQPRSYEVSCEQALHLGERSQSREGYTLEKWRECPWPWRKTDVKIQFPFQVIASAFNLSVHHPALSKVKACRLGLSCSLTFRWPLQSLLLRWTAENSQVT